MSDDFAQQFQAAFEAATGETPQQAVSDGFQGIDPNILMSAATALQAYGSSPEGKAAIAAAGGLSPSMLGNLFGGALQSSWFADIYNELISISPVKALSLGVMGEVDFIVGLAANAGYAMDLENFGSTSAIYIGGGGEVGISGGVDLDLCLGLWTETTENIGGFMTGAEIELDDGAGMVGIAFGDKDSIEGAMGGTWEDLVDVATVIFVGVGIGLDDGADGDEYYFWTGNFTNDPVYQSGQYDYMVMLTDLVCNNSQAHLGDHDTVTMTYTIDGHSTEYKYPMWSKMYLDTGSDSTFFCGNMIRFNDSFEITLHVSHADDMSLSWQVSDFNSGNNWKKAKTFDESSMGNDTEYTLTAQLIAVPTGDGHPGS